MIVMPCPPRLRLLKPLDVSRVIKELIRKRRLLQLGLFGDYPLLGAFLMPNS